MKEKIAKYNLVFGIIYALVGILSVYINYEDELGLLIWYAIGGPLFILLLPYYIIRRIFIGKMERGIHADFSAQLFPLLAFTIIITPFNFNQLSIKEFVIKYLDILLLVHILIFSVFITYKLYMFVFKKNDDI